MSLIHAIIGNHMPNMAYGMPFMALKKQIMLHAATPKHPPEKLNLKIDLNIISSDTPASKEAGFRRTRKTLTRRLRDAGRLRRAAG